MLKTDGRGFRIAGPERTENRPCSSTGGYALRVAFSDGLLLANDFEWTAARDGETARPFIRHGILRPRLRRTWCAPLCQIGHDLDPIALHDCQMAAAAELSREAAE